MHWLVLASVGAAVGFLGGLFGKGGSAIATPVLAAVGVRPIAAVASPLPATIPGTLIAYGNYRGHGHSAPRVIRWSVVFGLPATIAGAAATRWIDGGSLVRITDVAVALIGLRILLAGRTEPAQEIHEEEPSRARLAGVATLVGFLAGLLANAGGFLLVPLYLAVLHLPIKRALASSLAVASVLAVPGTIVHAALGHIDWRVAVVFGVASIPLSGVGARVAVRMNPARLERIYGTGLFALGLAFLVRG